MKERVRELYGNKTRIRVCGICIKNSAILLINHVGVTDTAFWAPPGGGLEFGEDVKTCLKREFQEETGLVVEVGDFLFTSELVNPPLHALELFFSVHPVGGMLTTGFDPESGENQLIREVVYLTDSQVGSIPPGQRHGLFQRAPKIDQITSLKGYFKL